MALRASWLVPAALLLAYLVTQYGSSVRIPFINEDYAFLDVTRGRSLFSLWHVTAASADPWIRPWSQGFHYWLLQSVLGLHVVAWHVVSLILGLSILLSYYTLGLGFLVQPFSARRQTLHDRIAKTLVLRHPRRMAAAGGAGLLPAGAPAAD